LDGPLVVPRIYDGRNRTFFMASYEGLRQIRKSAVVMTVITPLMFQGNFTQNPGAVRDPANRDAGGIALPFPGNLIPAARLSAPVQKVRQYYPTPGLSGVANNFPTSLANNNSTDQT